jgi:hypothetical protein
VSLPNLLATHIQFVLALIQLFLLLGETQELVERFLVNVIVLFQVMIGFFEFLEELESGKLESSFSTNQMTHLLQRHSIVLWLDLWQCSQICDLLGAFLDFLMQ